ncbi:MAG: F0F1 ATP synthase subunit epsilon [Veillonellaceae bacterium]|nr:F0F1 ATP synthase subunit epsilon [Veillonellaceae bacterium]
MSTNLSAMRVEIITPDGTVFSDDNVDMVVARALDGEFGIMRNHAPLVAALKIWPVRIKKGDEEISIAVFGGFLEVRDNEVHIISGQAETPESIDVERAQQARERALARLESDDAEIDRVRAELALQRALMRLRVAGGSQVK